MNELLDEVSSNDPVIARLRSALDEVSAESHGLVPVSELRPRVSAGRWMAAAASVVLVAGAVTAIAINRGNAPEVSSTPTQVATTTPTTSEPELIRSVAPWFQLIAADLVPGERTLEQCCRDILFGGALVMAWSRADPAAYLMVTEFPEPGPSFVVGATLRQGTSGMLSFVSYGLTDDERGTLSGQLVAGSGLPYVLPVDGWELEAIGYSGGENRLVQMYTPLNQDPVSSYLPTVTMSVGEYRGELSWLAGWPDPQPVTVAGYDGWKVTEGDGTVSVFWDAGDTTWATLRIDPTLADRADALIAGVIQVTEEVANQPTVETVLVPDTTLTDDTGQELTALAVGDQLTGNLLSMASTGPTLFVFVDPDCVPCTNAVRTLLATERANPTRVPQIALVVDRPSTDFSAGDWLAETTWAGAVVYDSDGSGAALFGVDAVPYFVFIAITRDGTILDLSAGLFTSETLAELGIR